MRKNILLCKKFNAPIIVTSGALSKWELRGPRELAALANLLGLDLGKAIETVSTTPAGIIEKNKAKLAGKHWEGVSIVEE